MVSGKSDFDRKILVIVLTVEALLLWSFYCREIAWYPPLNSDQLAYLEEAYRLRARILEHGLGDLLRVSWYKGHVSGLLLPIEGALSGLLLGWGPVATTGRQLRVLRRPPSFRFLYSPKRVGPPRLWIRRCRTYPMPGHSMASLGWTVRFPNGFLRLLPLWHLGMRGTPVEAFPRSPVGDRVRTNRRLPDTAPFLHCRLPARRLCRICGRMRCRRAFCGVLTPISPAGCGDVSTI